MDSAQQQPASSLHRGHFITISAPSPSPKLSFVFVEVKRVPSPTLPRRRRRIDKRLSQLTNQIGMPEMALEPSEPA
ncbi:hypothetical protein CKAN_02660100 [Cinnamomum micranthum f. kanehirae]|uniref:Uncharacterized protein n=1 Tax=Cinnamomum micranthum f. kanehirae TaxID=337451 RepID=A0A443Q2D2_9MAGN|nr:hypothetical protein CKAN_02660100 [Cinnamomum micranthum f. kanehirae]